MTAVNALKQQCTAKSKASGQRCKRWAVTGYRVCQVHGAGSPHKGRPGGRPVTNGRWSKQLPTRLLERYETSARDAELLALREEIALVDSRIGDVLSRVDSGESGAIWQAVGLAYAALMQAKSAGKAKEFAAALGDLGALIERGRQDYAAWADVIGLIEQRRRLVESERKRLVDMQNMMTAEEALTLAARLASIVREHVKDPHVLSAISREFGGLVRLPDRRDADTPAR